MATERIEQVYSLMFDVKQMRQTSQDLFEVLAEAWTMYALEEITYDKFEQISAALTFEYRNRRYDMVNAFDQVNPEGWRKRDDGA